MDRYCANDITWLDIFVLCKLCAALNCEIRDLIVFLSAGKKRKNSLYFFVYCIKMARKEQKFALVIFQ